MFSFRGLLAVVVMGCAAVYLACGGGDDEATPTPAPTQARTRSPSASGTQYIMYRDAVGFIVAQDLETTESMGHPVDFNTEVVISAACSPDGGRIAFLRQFFDRATRTLQFRDENGIQQEIELPATTQGFDWSPDGSRIVYSEFSGFENTHKVSVIDLASGETAELTSGDAIASSPAWSPDGSVIAFDISDILATRSDIYLINPDGSDGPEQIEITTEGQWRDPSWAPDGRLLVAGLVDGKQQLYQVPESGGEPELVTDSPDIFKNGPRYSPDGLEIAYTGSVIQEQVSAAILKLHSFGIFLVSPDGSDERALTADPRLNPGASADPYLDAYLLGWCSDGSWMDDSWVPVEAQPTPEGQAQ
jgi:Tol biopolymer transport system component